MSTPGPSTLPTRPRTSKPRGVCRYYTTPRGCFAGNSCKFLHAQEPEPLQAPSGNPLLTPYDQAKTCRYYTNGYCRRGDSCWFKHVREGKEKATASSSDNESDSSESNQCSICYEQPTTYGLLAGCNHVFCIKCIKSWRDPSSKSIDFISPSNTKSCPMCRTPSHFITPSSIFVSHGTLEKDKVMQSYKDSMARVSCRYFLKTRGTSHPMCPFGKDCFYRHERTDGTLHTFEEGADVYMTRYASRHTARGRRLYHLYRRPFSFSFSDSEDGEFDDDDEDDFFPPFDIQLSLADLFPGVARMGGNVLGIPPPVDMEVTAGNVDPPANLEDSILNALQNVRNTAGANDPTDDEAQERIEILAEQMLTSLNVIRNRGSSLTQPRGQPSTAAAAAPMPPRGGAVDDDNDSMPSLQSVSDSDNDDDDETYDDMSSLDTISDSDDDYDSEDKDEDSDDEALDAMLWDVLGADTTSQGTESVNINEASLFDVIDRLQTMVTASSPQEQQDEEGDEDVMPELEAVSAIAELGDEPGPAETPRPPNVSSPEPPYVTDGRGRVVWTSNNSNSPARTATEGPSPALRRVEAPAPVTETAALVEGLSSNPQRPKAVVREPSHNRSSRPNINTGFTTDGRGRVVAAGSPPAQDTWHPALTLYSQIMNDSAESGQRRLELDEVD